jgi:hypothetical protein
MVIVVLMVWITLPGRSWKAVHYLYSIMEKPARAVDNLRADVDNF